MKKLGILVIALFLMVMALAAPVSAADSERHIGNVSTGGGTYSINEINQETGQTCMVGSMAMIYDFYGYDEYNHDYDDIYAWSLTQGPYYNGLLSPTQAQTYFSSNHFYSTSKYLDVDNDNANTYFDNVIRVRMSINAPIIVGYCVGQQEGVNIYHTIVIDGYYHDEDNNSLNKVYLHDPDPEVEGSWWHYWEDIVEFSTDNGGDVQIIVPPSILHMN
jgi:hypothetical protein